MTIGGGGVKIPEKLMTSFMNAAILKLLVTFFSKFSSCVMMAIEVTSDK